MRIAIGEFTHESNSFSSSKTTEEMFTTTYGDQIIERNNSVHNYVGGMIHKGTELEVDLLPTFSARCSPSGVITREAFEKFSDELIKSILREKEIDGICLALHGGGVAEEVFNIEGEILKRLREAVGSDIPIVVSLDLHANLSETVVENATALLGVNHYPHTDTYERGEEAMEMLVHIVEEKIDPVMTIKRIPLLIFPSTSYQSPVKEINELCWRIEERDDVLDCTFYHGFARADTPLTGASVITITNGKKELSEQISTEVALEVWENREAFTKNFPTPLEGLDEAVLETGKPIVVNETADNPGSGAPGDGTFLLEAMIERNIPASCFGFIYDPEVAKIAHEQGVGSTIDVQLGGKSDTKHGAPLEVRAYVKTLTDGKFIRTSRMSQGELADVGKSARLQIGNVDVIVCSVHMQTTDEQIFVLHGIDIQKMKIVALKSAQHFRASFEPLAHKIITVDSPGISTSNPAFYPYEQIRRPMYPLDVDCVFK